MLTIRRAEWPRDIAALSALDTEMVTETIYRPVGSEMNFHLVEEAVVPPQRKRYVFDPADSEERHLWDFAVIAEDAEGAAAGFAAAQYVEWNRRVVLQHLYVAPAFRRQGLGTRLLVAVEEFARSAEVRCVWLETQNVNVPAIHFYQHAGFQFCGLDTTLYDPAHTPETEIALFFAREVILLP